MFWAEIALEPKTKFSQAGLKPAPPCHHEEREDVLLAWLSGSDHLKRMQPIVTFCKENLKKEDRHKYPKNAYS